MARTLATAILFACGCTPPPRPAPEPRPAPVQAPAPAPPPALELSPAPVAEPVQLSILQPAQGERLTLADAASTPVTVHSARPDWVLEVALDGRRLRPLATLPEEPTLGHLADGQGLEAGPHYLVAAIRAEQHAPARYAVSRFFVERSGSSSEPLVYCASPSGTYYGAGQPLLLDFVADPPHTEAGDAVRVRASRLGASEPAREALLREPGPRLVHGIIPGDWVVELELLDKDQRPLPGNLARHRCELTVNEAEAP